jgi:propionyl-CoA carboxylase alpha chain
VEACRSTGAEAVHPGYGFLSERAAFPEALAAAGIVFIGPNPAAIAAMGDKIESKKAAAAANVSTVPGHLGVIETAAEAERIATEIGYPVMIKASAGGGGKGMRVAWSASEVREGFDRARGEAASSFGDDRVFIEKFIVEPRHVEIQVLADKHGNAVYLGERECSIQRRNQKVIEEAPSPLLDAATRRAMGEQAVALARAVGYDSAGTVEFVAGQDRSFFFLEMNTRLQVEHPVTELVTGIDLVEQMIRVAAGEKLAITQADVRLDGWAVEARLYAEDPFRGFLPSIGRLVRYRPPPTPVAADRTVRVDSGVVEGSEISMFYDPMLAKLVTHAPTRLGAIDAMADALDGFVVDGIGHNLPFISALMEHPRWREGRLSTAFLAEEYPEGFAGAPVDDRRRAVFAAVAVAIELARRARLARMPGRLRARPEPLPDAWVVEIESGNVGVTIAHAETNGTLTFDLRIDGGDPISVETGWRPGEALWRGAVGGEAVTVQVRPGRARVVLGWRGTSVSARVTRPRVAALAAQMPQKAAPDTSRFLRCPMPGLVVSIDVIEGQDVKLGDQLAVVEAMKMQNVLKAERDLTIAAIRAKPGESLAVDAVIMEFA